MHASAPAHPACMHGRRPPHACMHARLRRRTLHGRPLASGVVYSSQRGSAENSKPETPGSTPLGSTEPSGRGIGCSGCPSLLPPRLKPAPHRRYHIPAITFLPSHSCHNQLTEKPQPHHSPASMSLTMQQYRSIPCCRGTVYATRRPSCDRRMQQTSVPEGRRFRDRTS